jgi:hypothetical protein
MVPIGDWAPAERARRRRACPSANHNRCFGARAIVPIERLSQRPRLRQPIATFTDTLRPLGRELRRRKKRSARDARGLGRLGLFDGGDGCNGRDDRSQIWRRSVARATTAAVKAPTVSRSRDYPVRVALICDGRHLRGQRWTRCRESQIIIALSLRPITSREVAHSSNSLDTIG